MREICKLIQTAQKGYKQTRQITRHGNSTPFVSDISPVSTADVHVPVDKKNSGGRVMQPYLTEELTPPCQIARRKRWAHRADTVRTVHHNMVEHTEVPRSSAFEEDDQRMEESF
jgi:hypothetical protein